MANAIQWISRRAKALKRKHPRKHTKYTGYVKDASAEYRRKHSGKKKRAKPTRRATVKRTQKVKRVGSTPKRSIGSLTVSQHVSSAKNLIAEKIAHLELRKFVSHKKTDKRKISKQIRELKRNYSKLRT
jgi:hypothetical protein